MPSKIFSVAVVWDARGATTTISQSMGIDAMDGRNHDFTTFEKANKPAKVNDISVGKINA